MKASLILVVALLLSVSAQAADKCLAVFSKSSRSSVVETYKAGHIEGDAKYALRLAAQQIPRKTRQQIFNRLFNKGSVFGQSVFEIVRNQQLIPVDAVPTDNQIRRMNTEVFGELTLQSAGLYDPKYSSYILNLIRVATPVILLSQTDHLVKVYVNHTLPRQHPDDKVSILKRWVHKWRGFSEQVETPLAHTEIKNLREGMDYLRRQAYLEEQLDPIAVKELARVTDQIEDSLHAKKFDQQELKRISLTKLEDIPVSLRKDLAILELEKAQIVAHEFTLKNIELANSRYSEATDIIVAHAKNHLRRAFEYSDLLATQISNNGPHLDRSFEAFEKASNYLREFDMEAAKYSADIAVVEQYAKAVIQNYSLLRETTLQNLSSLPESDQTLARAQLSVMNSKIRRSERTVALASGRLKGLTPLLESVIDQSRLALVSLPPNATPEQQLNYKSQLRNSTRELSDYWKVIPPNGRD